MKNKEFKTLMAIVTLTGSLLLSLTAGAVPVCAAETNDSAANPTVTTTSAANKDSSSAARKDSSSETAKDNSSTAKKGSSSENAKPYKSETVYATTDGSGTVKSITVSDQLKNISDISEVTDKSNLKKIENVKGDESFTSKGETLVWNTNDADICYQGTTAKALPVGIKVTYLLDGKEVTADRLTGQSGHLTIRYTYENHTGKQGGTATPFLMATGLVLDGTMFKNVTVTNGRLISDGDREMAVGFGIPSLQEMLGTDTLDIPDYFEVEADVTNYEPVEGMTIATNSPFNDLETDGFDSLSDLQSSMNQLQSASAQLVDGSGELRTGLDTLLSSSGTLKDGIQQLADGSVSLTGGTKTLKDGTYELSAGLNTASSKVSGELLPGIQALDAGMTQMQGSLNEGLPALSNGISALDSGINQVADGTAALSNGLSQAGAGASALSNGLSQVGAGTEALNTNVQALGTAVSTLNGFMHSQQPAGADISGQFSTLITEISNLAGALHTAADQAGQTTAATYSAGAGTDSYDEISTLQALLDNGLITDDAAAASISGVIQTLSDEQYTRDSAGTVSLDNSVLQGTLATLADQADTLADAAGAVVTEAANASNPAALLQLQAAIQELDANINGEGGLVDSVAMLNAAINTGDGTNPGLTAGAAQLDAALNTGDGANPSILSAIGQLDAALNTGNADAGIPSLRGGISTLNQSVNGEGGLTEQVTGGVAQLKDGTSRLLSGVDGENGLSNGLKLLNAGAIQLADGSTALNTGANTLADGIGTLQNGSGALIDGVQQLDDGAAKLNDGMIQFDEDGIKKLTEAFGGDVQKLLDTANELLNASRDYKNFSGIADDMDGEVKFVFVTE